MSESIHHPVHYGGDNTYEAIKVIEHYNLDFHLGNVLKYILRADKKGKELEDLMKAQWYLNRRIEQYEHNITKRQKVSLNAIKTQ